MAVLKKVELFWSDLVKPNDMSGKYQVNLGNLTDEHVKILIEDMGVDAGQIKEPKEFSEKEDPEGKKAEAAKAQGRYITVKSNFPIRVINGKKEELDEATIKTIGNGSIANVQVNPYEWEFKTKSGISAGVQQVQLLKLNKFEGVDELEVEEDELGAQDFDAMVDELEEDLD